MKYIILFFAISLKLLIFSQSNRYLGFEVYNKNDRFEFYEFVLIPVDSLFFIDNVDTLVKKMNNTDERVYFSWNASMWKGYDSENMDSIKHELDILISDSIQEFNKLKCSFGLFFIVEFELNIKEVRSPYSNEYIPYFSVLNEVILYERKKCPSSFNIVIP